jgi:hypothetical protein
MMKEYKAFDHKTNNKMSIFLTPSNSFKKTSNLWKSKVFKLSLIIDGTTEKVPHFFMSLKSYYDKKNCKQKCRVSFPVSTGMILTFLLINNFMTILQVNIIIICR